MGVGFDLISTMVQYYVLSFALDLLEVGGGMVWPDKGHQQRGQQKLSKTGFLRNVKRTCPRPRKPIPGRETIKGGMIRPCFDFGAILCVEIFARTAGSWAWGGAPTGG